MIKCKEDLMNTYIVNNCQVKIDTYISLSKNLGCSLMSGDDAAYVKNTIADTAAEYTAIDGTGYLFVRENWIRMKDACGVDDQIPAEFKQLHLSYLIDLENSKVYTTDKEVIWKYAELCGRDGCEELKVHCNDEIGATFYGGGEYFGFFVKGSNIDTEHKETEITPEQINALYAEKFGQTETPEEAEAFGDMDRVNEQQGSNASEWNGEGLPPVGVDCEILFEDYPEKGFGLFNVLAYHGGAIWVQYIGPLGNNGKCYTAEFSTLEFRKPETEAERNERERLEAAYDLYLTRHLSMPAPYRYDEFLKAENTLNGFLAIVDKTNYRKSTN